ncbi:hypothetical protein CRE_30464 [Caenorhabditis remanei]|uniref:polynucleotide adenylyltransferase n=1 Tax=Caenorhabditis remanei TaxID=31234 RepID=E3NDY3_CAERE|nr:hypothetical protein CRE_30464 [Caenorhabditis remanei]
MEGNIAAPHWEDLTENEMTRLAKILKPVEIHSRRTQNAITMHLTLLMQTLVNKLRDNGIDINGVYLIGGAASYVVSSVHIFNDIDLMMSVGAPNGYEEEKKLFNSIRDLVVKCIGQMTASAGSQYFHKTHLTHNNNGDSWSLLSLYNMYGKNIELKFVLRLARDFVFSTDSIKVDISPQVFGLSGENRMTSSFGNLEVAKYHIQNRMIDTINPQQIKGGGFLKFVHLKCKKYKVAKKEKDLEQLLVAMTEGFLREPYQLEKYLANHFRQQDVNYKIGFLRKFWDICNKPCLQIFSEDLERFKNTALEICRRLEQ